jgi:hypothetical protein
MKLFALKKPDGTFDHQSVATTPDTSWELAAGLAHLMGDVKTTDQFKAELEAGGYTVVPVNITEATNTDNIEDLIHVHCNKCGTELMDDNGCPVCDDTDDHAERTREIEGEAKEEMRRRGGP